MATSRPTAAKSPFSRPMSPTAVAAGDTAATAVGDIGRENGDFAAVGLLVAIAIGEARRARAVAGAGGATHRCHVVGRADRAAAATAASVRLSIDLAAVGLLVAVAVGVACRAGAIAASAAAGDGRHVARRAGDTAATAVGDIGRENGDFAAV